MTTSKMLAGMMERAADRIEELEREKDELTQTKDGAYLERNRLVALLAKFFPSGVKQTAIEGWDPDWHGCVFIDLPTGQASWHFHKSQEFLFEGLPAYRGEWDGHSTEEKYRRIERTSAPSMLSFQREGSCPVCGGWMVRARPRFPQGAFRMVCPTCLADRMALVHEHSSPDFGRAYAVVRPEDYMKVGLTDPPPSIAMKGERAKENQELDNFLQDREAKKSGPDLPVPPMRIADARNENPETGS